MINNFTLTGKMILVANCIALILAIFLHKYDGLPFILISVLCAFVAFKK